MILQKIFSKAVLKNIKKDDIPNFKEVFNSVKPLKKKLTDQEIHDIVIEDRVERFLKNYK